MSLYDPSLNSLSLSPCRRLLHNTLLKDNLNRSSSSLSLPTTTSSSPMSRSTRQVATQSPRRPHTTHATRDHSPLTDRIQPSSHLITPHEQVLRARLERVLFSAGVADSMTKPRGRSPSLAPSATGTNGNPTSIKRIRSKTESNIPLLPPVSPRTPYHPHRQSHPLSDPLVRPKNRTSTGRSSGSGSASCSGSASPKRLATGSTPPLVPDDDDGSGGEARLSLLTPPSTPSPSGLGFFQVDKLHYKPTRRVQDHDEEEDDDDESCASSCSSYRQGSSISSSGLPSSFQHRPPLSPQPLFPPTSPHSPNRPFNARRASAQCRAIEGYVSFANVEGLGVPDEPGSPTSPHSQVGKGSGVLTALGWGGAWLGRS